MQLNMFTKVPASQAVQSRPRKSAPTKNLSVALRENKVSIDAALQNIFKSSQEETRIQQARRMMGVAIDELPDEELEVCLTEFQHLIDQWLDAFEQGLFDGHTLKQVLGQA